MGCPADAELAHFVDGTLSADARSSIEEHLDACRSCRQAVSAAARRGPRSSAELSVRAGDQVGRYQLIAPLGAGAMGVVFEAHDPELDRRVAIKLLPASVAADRQSARQQRLAREARALARISHPNVVPVFDVATAGDRLFVAMELVEGETLRAHIATAQLGMHERLALLGQAAHGLAAAHAAGVIHRDFKPDNVLVGRDGRVRVSDFGLAIADDEELALGEPHDGAGGELPITKTGALLGTPAYMAPEQLRGERATAASDQFALCITAWEVLFGTRPFVADDVPGLVASIQQGPPPAPAPLDKALLAALCRGLAFDAARRHRDLDLLISCLRARRRSHWRLAAAGALAAALAGGAAIVATSSRDAPDPCARAAAGLDAVWNPAARATLISNLTATDQALAGEHSDAAIRAIDRWATAWRNTSTATCAAHRDGTRSAALFDRQQACLSDRRDELAALLSVLADPSVDRTRAPSAAAALSELGPCTRDRLGEPVIELTADAQRQLDDARRVLARGRALLKTGRFREVIRELEPLVTSHPASIDPRFAGETLLTLASAEQALSKLDSARDHLSAAAARGELARDDSLKARAWIELLSLIGDGFVEIAEAARLEPLARAAVERAGGAASLRASLAMEVTKVAFRRGEHRQAIAAFEQAIEWQRQRIPADPIALANVLNSASGPHGALGDHERMLALADEALALVTEAVGAGHPNVAAAEANRVAPLHYLGRNDDALAAATRAVEITKRSLGEGIQLAAMIANRALVLSALHRHDEAAADLDRARVLRESALGLDHVDIGQDWLNLGSIYLEAERIAEAADAYRRALSIWDRALGSDHPNVARPLQGLGEVALAGRDPRAAIPPLERALAIRQRHAGNPEHLAHTRFMLAKALVASNGDRHRARQLAIAARDTYVEAKSDDDVADIDAWLASSRLQTTRRTP
ncbi:MAG: protein kinase [Kofleriaceae bacterium]